jgi:glutamate-ammonia-ligase adenylyltransferase
MSNPVPASSNAPGLLAETQTRSLLEPIRFADRPAAHAILRRMLKNDGDAFADLLPNLLSALETAADPDRSLVYFERFAENYGPSIFDELARNPRVIEILVKLFSTSHFLTEILLRNPQTLSLLHDRQSLARRKTIDDFQSEAETALTDAHSDLEQLNALRRYQRGELLRIGVSDFLDLYDLRSVVSELSRMANGLVRACLSLASRETGIATGGFTVIAMGKQGGRELNYSSDIDLVFVSRDDAERYLPLADKLVEALARPTSEGFLYRIDLRLRPWGKDGTLIPTADGYVKYLENDARLWEKQALLKARAIAGDVPFGEALLERVKPIVYSNSPDEVRANVLAMKLRTEEYLQQKGRGWGEVKLGEGSIRDIEFVVQSMQLIYGGSYHFIRTRATLKGIGRLRAVGLLTPAESGVLTDGYIFLRTIEHYLQMMDYRQTYTLPSDPAAIALLARRLGFEGPKAGEHFVARYQQHCQAIRAVFLRRLGSVPMTEDPDSPTASPQVRQHMARMDASYTEAFTPEEIQRHASLAAQLDADQQALVDAVPIEGGKWKVSVVAYDYPGELSLLCGLMFVYGMNILDGDIFTYEPLDDPAPPSSAPRFNPTRGLSSRPRPASRSNQTDRPDTRRKLVDVFTVKPVQSGPLDPATWTRYNEDLLALLRLMRVGERREARGELAKRVGAAFEDVPSTSNTLLPIDITIDNQTSENYTLLRIDAPDTVGFLYELTNALAFYRIYIARMLVRSQGNRVQDLLYVTDEHNRKITDPERQRELRAAIVLIKHFTHLLPSSPNPEAALLHFREFIAHLFKRPNWPDELGSLESSNVLGALARLLGVSDFLWDDFLRMQYTNLFPVVRDVDALTTVKPRAELETNIQEALKEAADSGQDWREALNAIKDRELFRIDMRHILGLTAEFWDFSAELTDLAELVIQAGLENCLRELSDSFGLPYTAAGQLCPLTIFALGKCGGRELGFASDIELMFIYDGEGLTNGPRQILVSDFYERLVTAIVSAIHARQEGIFQIDLQLRPYGKAGSMAVSLDAFQRYYAPGGPAWAYERQALVKMRAIAGDDNLAQQVHSLRDEYVFHGGPFDVTAMRAMRERQVRHLVTGGTFNAKYSPGGLVDIEYLVQGLQINYGGENPSVRLTNIRKAMAALNELGVLSDDDYTRLRKAHTFLRWLIDSMRVVRGNAKDVTVPPYGSEEFAFLARRLLYGSDTERLRDDLARYAEEVQAINSRLL